MERVTEVKTVSTETLEMTERFVKVVSLRGEQVTEYRVISFLRHLPECEDMDLETLLGIAQFILV